MSTFISQIMAFFMSIMYFFGSFGIGVNDPVTINVSDSTGTAVSHADVYYYENGVDQDIISLVPIGTTDENGNVIWEDQKYGEQNLVITVGENTDPLSDDAIGKTIDVSRTKNEIIYIQIEL